MKGFKQRIVTACSAASIVTIIMGCMSFSIGGRHYSIKNEEESDSGTIQLPAGQELDVYYPVPFASPPNLTIEPSSRDYQIIEQKPDHFRIRNGSALSTEFKWKVRGVHANSLTPIQTGATDIQTIRPVADTQAK